MKSYLLSLAFAAATVSAPLEPFVGAGRVSEGKWDIPERETGREGGGGREEERESLAKAVLHSSVCLNRPASDQSLKL